MPPDRRAHLQVTLAILRLTLAQMRGDPPVAVGTSGLLQRAVIFTAVAPELSIFDIPFLFRDLAHARSVMDGDIGKAALARLSRRA